MLLEAGTSFPTSAGEAGDAGSGGGVVPRVKWGKAELVAKWQEMQQCWWT